MTNSPATNVPKPRFSAKSLLTWLLVLTLVRGVIYASVVPPWQAPDEPAHFERVRASLSAAEWNSTSKNGPAWYDDLIRSLFTFGFWDFLDADRPIYQPDVPLNRYISPYQEIYSGLYGSRLSYAVIGWPLFLARHQEFTLQLYLVRLNTVLMNVGIIWLAFLIVRTIFPYNTFLIVGVPCLILFNPQHTHLLSTVNNGNLAELLTTATFYFMIKGIIAGFNWRNILAVLGFAAAAIWTKATAYFLPVAIGCIALFYLWQYRQYWRRLLSLGLILVAIGLYFSPQRLRLLIPMGWGQLVAGEFYLDPIVPLDLFRSFWAMPGWTIFQLNLFWYWLIGLACTLALIGLITSLLSRRHLFSAKEFQPQIQALVVLAVAVVVAVGILISWNTLTESIVYRQGRSLYPVAVPISLFLILGWQQLIPKTWHGVGLLIATTLFFLFDSLVLFDYIVPFFYSRY